MGNKLYISANNNSKMYECKTTHTGNPYLRVKDGYLDLTTKTTSNLKIKVKYNNQTYRPLQTSTSISSTSAEFIQTLGYSGYSSKASNYTSTTGYSGSLSKVSTSGYSGISSRKSTSGYSGRSTYTANRISSYGYTGYTTSSQSGNSLYTLIDYATAVLKAVYPKKSAKTISYKMSKSSYSSKTSNKTHNATMKVSWKGSNNLLSYATWSATTTAGNVTKSFPKMSVSGGAWAGYTFNVSVRGYYSTAKVSNVNDSMLNWWSKGFNLLTYTYTHTGRAKTSTTSKSGKGAASSTAVGALKSTTLLTRNSAYNTSSYRTSAAVGALLSTTALTRASNYNATSAAVGNLSSATALTRASWYGTTSGAVGAMASTAALTLSGTKQSNYLTSVTAKDLLSSATQITSKVSTSSSQSITTEV